MERPPNSSGSSGRQRNVLLYDNMHNPAQVSVPWNLGAAITDEHPLRMR